MRLSRWAPVLCLAVLLSGGTAVAKDKKKKVDLKVGDAAPVFEVKDDTGKLWKSSDHVGKKTVVVFFFPAAMTGG